MEGNLAEKLLVEEETWSSSHLQIRKFGGIAGCRGGNVVEWLVVEEETWWNSWLYEEHGNGESMVAVT